MFWSWVWTERGFIGTLYIALRLKASSHSEYWTFLNILHNFWRIYQQNILHFSQRTVFESKFVIFLSLHCALLPWQQWAAYIHRPQNIQQTNCRHILNSNLAATSQDDKKGVVLNQLGSGFCDSKTED